MLRSESVSDKRMDGVPHARRSALASLLVGAFALTSPCFGSSKLALRAVVVDEDSVATRNIVNLLQIRYSGIVVVSNLSAERRSRAIYLAIGPRALRALLDADVAGPVVSLFSTRESFRDLTAHAGGRASAIYSEASPESQLRLINHIFEQGTTVGVLLGESSADLAPVLRQEAKRLGLELQVRIAEKGASPPREFAYFDNAAVLLAVPDTRVFNGETLRGILESTYRRGQAIIGFSPALVNAGTLAAAYSSVEDVLSTLDLMLPELEASSLPEARYPIYWRTAVNDSVARSLNILFPKDIREFGNQPRPK